MNSVDTQEAEAWTQTLQAPAHTASDKSLSLSEGWAPRAREMTPPDDGCATSCTTRRAVWTRCLCANKGRMQSLHHGEPFVPSGPGLRTLSFPQ